VISDNAVLDLMAHSSIPVDETILGNPANEETDTLQYWIQASAYLLNFVSADPGLSRLPISEQIKALLLLLENRRTRRESSQSRKCRTRPFLFGPVGKASVVCEGQGGSSIQERVGEVRNQSNVRDWQSLIFVLYCGHTCREWL